jgi:hypothetical protein
VYILPASCGQEGVALLVGDDGVAAGAPDVELSLVVGEVDVVVEVAEESEGVETDKLEVVLEIDVVRDVVVDDEEDDKEEVVVEDVDVDVVVVVDVVLELEEPHESTGGCPQLGSGFIVPSLYTPNEEPSE